jgi:hypothetical protein
MKHRGLCTMLGTKVIKNRHVDPLLTLFCWRSIRCLVNKQTSLVVL